MLFRSELPIEMASLPALLMEVRHHRLAKAVDRDLIDPLGQPFAPIGAVGSKIALHFLTRHGVAPVVAVANIVGTFEGRECHRSRAQEPKP